MAHTQLLPWRYNMFGFGNRNTSYAFLAAAIFFVASGREYHTFAAICGAISLVMAYMKIHDLEKDIQQNWLNRDMDDRTRDMSHEFSEIRREIGDLHEKLCDRDSK